VARNAARWGVEIHGDIKVDLAKVKARKDAIVAESQQSLARWLGGTKNLTLIDGHARFVSPETVEVGGRRLTGTRFFINTGARVLVPPIPGLAGVPYLTNTSIMDVDTLPRHLLILGGSYIGLEFAQMYRRFGSEVTVIERSDRLIGREDPEVSAEIRAALEEEGVTFRLASQVARVAKSSGAESGSELEVELGGGETLRGSQLLAIGRIPNSQDLGLEAAGVTADARGYIVVDDHLRTNQRHIWALGDVNGRGAFTHTSYDDFQLVAANLLDGADRRLSHRFPIYGLYVDPPLGRCGMNEAEARASGRRVLVAKREMSRVGRARERGETRGFIKIMVDADTQRILGAAILGIEGDEAIHCIVDIMYADAPYTVLQQAVHAHPTVSELIPTVLGELRPLA
jgi:pyruvate/2-oxoglutarate dehydrogenase complex dihydrolipoamide dehydrogenase (E3) component